ncbi:hypothetical protein BCU66_011165 [Vibrio sp. 10N.286.49.B1]|nr:MULTISPECIES: hypothetical protein [unclassified Vibrio]
MNKHTPQANNKARPLAKFYLAQLNKSSSEQEKLTLAMLVELCQLRR